MIPVWAWQTGYHDYTRQAMVDLGARTTNFKGLAVTGYFYCDYVTSQSKHVSFFVPFISRCFNDTERLDIIHVLIYIAAAI
jgi:hypothetical protein